MGGARAARATERRAPALLEPADNVTSAAEPHGTFAHRREQPPVESSPQTLGTVASGVPRQREDPPVRHRAFLNAPARLPCLILAEVHSAGIEEGGILHVEWQFQQVRRVERAEHLVRTRLEADRLVVAERRVVDKPRSIESPE